MRKHAKRLSIGIGCHGSAGYLAGTLDSFLQSSCLPRETEIVICDDFSPPGGDGDTARAYAARCPELIRVFRNDRGEGVARVYQKLREEARGEYFMPFDSDDIFLPFDLERSMAFLDRHSEYAASYGKKRLFDEENGDRHESHGGDHSVFALSFNPRATHNAMLIRADDLDESGGYLPKCLKHVFDSGPDVAMWLGLGVKKLLKFEDGYRALYRVHPGQHSRAKAERYAQGYRRMQEDVFELFPELYRALRERREVRIAPEMRLPAAVLLGAMFQNASDPGEAMYCLDAAMQIVPEDYAVLEYKIGLLLKLGRAEEALALSMLMLSRHGGSLYVEGVAYALAAAAAKQLGLDPAEILKLRGMVVERFFRLTPEQRAALEAVRR